MRIFKHFFLKTRIKIRENLENLKSNLPLQKIEKMERLGGLLGKQKLQLNASLPYLMPVLDRPWQSISPYVRLTHKLFILGKT